MQHIFYEFAQMLRLRNKNVKNGLTKRNFRDILYTWVAKTQQKRKGVFNEQDRT